MAEEVKLVAPDGGWGWMVVVAMAINNVITIPILQNFGLLFRDVFKILDMPVQDVNIILNTNAAFGYVLGVLNGPILRNLGFRKVAVAGGLMMFVGLFVTSFAHTFIVFFIFYGMINSLGIGWSMASCHLALSTYFVERRGMAMGIAMTITGLGPVVMPLVISKLMFVFGDRGTALLLSGLVLNTVVGGLLLQPVKWHRKPVTSSLLTKPEGVANDKPLDDKEPLNSTEEITARRDKETSVKIGTPQDEKNKDIELEDLAASKNLLDNKPPNGKKSKESWYQIVANALNLDLLKDPAFLSMCIGMSIALASDMNFSLLLPFILDDYKFDTNTTAILLSIVGASDILSRFFMPFIIKRTNLSARIAYLLSLISLILSRFLLTIISHLHGVMVVVAFFGASKGIRAVFMPLVIPNYVPLDKLASAQGLQNVLHGLFLMVMGPLIGYFRDESGSYILCIHIMNALTTLTILLWTIEFVYMRSQKKNTFVDVADVER